MSRHLRDALGFQVPIWLDGRAEDRGIEPLRLQAAIQRFAGVPATRLLYQTFRMDLCDIHHNHQIPFLIWEADKCLVVNADGRAREIAPLSFLRESRFPRGVKIPTLRKPRRAGHPAT